MTLRKREDIKTWEVEGEAVLYDPNSGMGHILNPTALRIWALCDGQNTTGDIAQTLAGEFPNHQDEIRRDVEAVVTQLSELGLAEAA